MGRKAGIISIDLVAGTAQFKADMDQAKAKVRDFGSHSVSGVQAASGAIRTLEGNVQNNVRAVERFLVTTLKLGPVLQAAFPIVGAVAFGGMVFKIGEEVVAFYRKMEQAPSRIAGAFRELNAPLRLTNEELQVTNDRLANDIAKLEGKRPNTLKLALDEAAVSADKLAAALEKDLTNLNKLLKEENVSRWKTLLGGGAATSDITQEFGGQTGTGGFFGRVAAITDEGNAKIRAATDAKSRDAAQTELNTRLAKLYAEQLQKVNGWLEATARLQHEHEHPTVDPRARSGDPTLAAGANNTFTPADQSGRLELLRGVIRNLTAEMASIGLNAANASLTQKKSGLEADHPGVEELKRLRNQLAEARANELKGFDKLAAEENAELGRIKEMRLSTEQLAQAKTLVAQIFDAKRLTYFWEEYEKLGKTTMELADHMERMKIEAHKLAEEGVFGEQIKEGKKQIEENARALTKLAEAYTKVSSEAAKTKQAHSVRMLALDNPGADPVAVLSAQQAEERQAIQDRYNASLKDATTDWERATVLKQKNLDLDKLDYELEEKKAEQRQRGVRDFFVEMQHGAQTAGNILYSAMHSALDRTSEELAKLFTGQKTNFRGLVTGIGQELARDTVKSGLQRGLGALGSALGIKGLGPKPDGSSADRALWVRMASPLGALPGGTMGTTSGGNIGRIFGGSAGGGIFNLLGNLVKPFGGGRAGGGSVSADQAYVVGEHGPELLVGASGRIASHTDSLRSLGGSGEQHYYSIDARGTDPALVEERVVRAIQRAHDSAVSTSVRATIQRTQRVPPGR